jgi:hypothetical protein
MIKHGIYTHEGAKHAALTMGRGFTQFSLELGEKLGTVERSSVERYTAYIKEQNYLYSLTPAANSICGKFSEEFTYMIPYLLPMGLPLQGARAILWASGTTAGITAVLYPTQDGLLSTRLGVGLNAAAWTGLMGTGLTLATPLVRRYVPLTYNHIRNTFGRTPASSSATFSPSANAAVELNAGVMERAQIVVQELELAELNAARQSITPLDTPVLVFTKSPISQVNKAASRIVVNGDTRLPMTHSSVNPAIKPPKPTVISEARLSDVGKVSSPNVRVTRYASQQARSSLGHTRAELKSYLKNINSVPREQLIKDLNSIGLKYIGGSGDGKYCKFMHPERGFSVRIDDVHPPKRNNGCKYQHIHLFDKHGNSLNADLKGVPPSSPDAHIKISELLKILELKP